MTTRRTFLQGLTAALVMPRISHAAEPPILVDACNGFPLARVRIRFTDPASGTRLSVRTRADGSWDPAELQLRSINDVSALQVIIRARSVQGIPYYGLRLQVGLKPDGRLPASLSRLSLVPRTSPGLSRGIDDAVLNSTWPVLLRETLLNRGPAAERETLSSGHFFRWSQRQITLLIGQSLTETEQQFISPLIQQTVRRLSGDRLRISRTATLPLADEPLVAGQVLPGSIVVLHDRALTRPAVQLYTPSRTEGEILAARIGLGNYTLDTLFRDGHGTPDGIALASHLVQRCTAEALGYGPSRALPNRTVLDANAPASGTITRVGIRPEDDLLAAILYAPWAMAGMRLDTQKNQFVAATLV